jgi:hypothetical protein
MMLRPERYPSGCEHLHTVQRVRRSPPLPGILHFFENPVTVFQVRVVICFPNSFSSQSMSSGVLPAVVSITLQMPPLTQVPQLRSDYLFFQASQSINPLK